jgi:transposase-like protein
MTNPTRTRRRFTAQQKAEAVELCLQEGLSCNAVAERLGLPSSSLTRWVRQARIDRGQAGPRDQGLLTSEERAELNRLRKENRELRREKDFSGLAAGHFAKELLPQRLRLINQLAEPHPFFWLCQQMGAALTGCQAWQYSCVTYCRNRCILRTELRKIINHPAGTPKLLNYQ